MKYNSEDNSVGDDVAVATNVDGIDVGHTYQNIQLYDT